MTARDVYEGRITCPSCSQEFIGHWTGSKTGIQACPACGHRWTGTWRGFTFEPRTRVIARPPAREPGSGAA